MFARNYQSFISFSDRTFSYNTVLSFIDNNNSKIDTEIDKEDTEIRNETPAHSVTKNISKLQKETPLAIADAITEAQKNLSTMMAKKLPFFQKSWKEKIDKVSLSFFLVKKKIRQKIDGIIS